MSDVDAKAAICWLLDSVGAEVWLSPFGCSECPFATPFEGSVNLGDPDEGYYNCALTGVSEVWGENPVCAHTGHWRDLLRKSLDAAGYYDSRRMEE